jgi:predicted O-linked N-acetylglucosamine transferase (SPINDLY family)
MESNIKESSQSTEDILEMAKFKAEGVQFFYDSAKEFLSLAIQLNFDKPEHSLTENMQDLSSKITEINLKLQDFKEIVNEIQKDNQEIIETSKSIQIIESDLKKVLSLLTQKDENFKNQFKKLGIEQKNLTCEFFDCLEDFDQAKVEFEEICKEIETVERLRVQKKKNIQHLKQVLEKEEALQQMEIQELEILRKKLGQDTFLARNESISFESFKKTEAVAQKNNDFKENFNEFNYNKTYLLTVVLILVVALLTTN